MKLRTVLLALVAVALAGGCQLVSQAVGSKNNNLLSLVVTATHNPNSTPSSQTVKLYPSFSPDQTVYVAGSSWNFTDNLSVTANADDGSARVVVTGVNQTVELGGNRIQVRVTAENGENKLYQVDVFTAPYSLIDSAVASQLSTVHVVNHSGHALADLRFGLTVSDWEDNLLYGQTALANNGTYDMTVYPGPLDIFASDTVGGDAKTRDTSGYYWDSYSNDGNPGFSKTIGVLPGTSVTYEIK